MLEAERQLRRVTGYRDLAKLAMVIERDLGEANSSTGQDAILATA